MHWPYLPRQSRCAFSFGFSIIPPISPIRRSPQKRRWRTLGPILHQPRTRHLTTTYPQHASIILAWEYTHIFASGHHAHVFADPATARPALVLLPTMSMTTVQCHWYHFSPDVRCVPDATLSLPLVVLPPTASAITLLIEIEEGGMFVGTGCRGWMKVIYGDRQPFSLRIIART